MTTQPSPRPWRTINVIGGYAVVRDAEDHRVDMYMSPERAALIVQAVNAHAALVAALEAFEAAYDAYMAGDSGPLGSAINTARAALKAARGTK